MKKNFLCLILVLCMVFTMIPSMAYPALPALLDLAEGGITIENGTDDGTLKVTYGADPSQVDNIDPSTAISITQTNAETTTPSAIVISADVTDGVSIKLNGVNVQGVEKAALEITETAGKVNLILADNSDNKLTGDDYYAGLQKSNTAKGVDGLLTISCESANMHGHTCNDTCGNLTATGGYYGAGIGGGRSSDGSHISIYGGNITATGNIWGGAGIGGGGSSDGSHISIYGGNINAIGSNGGGAGIGGGDGGAGSNINIYGGSISATSNGGASIGGGDEGAGSNINIYGGSISATSNWLHAGIGGGSGGNGSHINIYDGIINATGGSAIGGGSGGTGSYINISGGIVTAVGKSSGTGIGGGYKKDGSNITISGGIVSATGGNNGGAAIGGGAGYYDSGSGYIAGGKGIDITISGGTVTANSTTNAYDIGGGGNNVRGDSSIIITGGNIYASSIGITPKNDSAENLYKATFSIPDDTTGGVNLEAMSFTSGGSTYDYNMEDDTNSILDEGKGKLFVYLPVGTYSTIYEDKTYTAEVDDSGEAEFVYLLPTITAFNFNGLTPNVTGTVDEENKAIALTVPNGTDVTELIPTITHTGASVSPNTGVAQNFTNPVEYTVTAADSSTQIYNVTVTVADPVDITAASVIITAPILGAAPQNAAAVQAATNNADYTVTGLVWNEPFTGGKFKADRVYTATVTLTSKNGKKFQAVAFTPTVAGSESVGTTTTSGGDVVGNTVSFTVTYPVTGALEVSSIAVTTQPTKMSYRESTDSVLELNGMQVTETNNDGSTNVVTFTDGTAAGYTTNPVNGSTLTNATHNGTPVVITHTASGMTSNTNPLTVNTAPSGGGGGGSGNSTPVPPAPAAPVITVSEVKSELFGDAEDIKVEADVNSAFGQSVEVKITDSTESQNEIFSLAGAEGEVYPFDISLYSKGSNQKVQPKDGYSVKITLPVPEKLIEDKEQIKVVYGKDGKLETLKSELIEKDGKWYIVFEAVHFSPYALVVSAEPSVSWTNPFSDVQEGSWYYSAIQYVAQNGLMLGTGGNTFSPQLTTNRGMIATILYRLNGSDETFQSTFKDVNSDAYYAKAVAWAQEKGIIAGYGNGMFGPEDSITREQMATILWRYAGSPVAAESKGLAGFKDAGEISAYAKDALAWIYETSIIAGKGNGILDPKGKATRAEVAQIMYNFTQKADLTE